MKRDVTVRIDEDLRKEATKLNINLSQLLETTLREVVEEHKTWGHNKD